MCPYLLREKPPAGADPVQNTPWHDPTEPTDHLPKQALPVAAHNRTFYLPRQAAA